MKKTLAIILLTVVVLLVLVVLCVSTYRQNRMLKDQNSQMEALAAQNTTAISIGSVINSWFS